MSRRGDGGVNIGDRTVNIGIIARRCRGESRGDGTVNNGDLSNSAVNISISRGDVAVNPRGDGSVNIGDRAVNIGIIARRCHGDNRRQLDSQRWCLSDGATAN